MNWQTRLSVSFFRFRLVDWETTCFSGVVHGRRNDIFDFILEGKVAKHFQEQIWKAREITHLAIILPFLPLLRIKCSDSVDGLMDGWRNVIYF